MSDRALRDTPYKGLMPYSEDDEDFFFGREPEQEIIAANLMASRFTLLYGPSGVGKSSVLRAGVAPDLRKQARHNLASRGKPRFVIIVFNEWKDDPLAGLLKQVRQSVKDSFNGQPFEPVPSNLSFTDEMRTWAECADGKLFIILDQFEEYFLYPQEQGEGSFAVEFPRAVNRSDLRVNFLISIREDWLAKLDCFKAHIPNLFDNYLRIEHLDRKAARNAIEQPVVQYNKLRAAGELEVIIKNGFFERVLEQLESLANKNVLGESGSGEVKGKGTSDLTKTRIQTTYLQIVMMRLWNEAMQSEPCELHPAMLDDPDRAEKIVQSHLNEVMEKLNADEQEVAARVFHHLVTPSGTKIAQKVSDLAEYAGIPKAELSLVMEKISHKESGVLTQLAPPPGQPNEPRYEIFHEVLARAILDWRTDYVHAQEQERAARRAAEEAAAREKETAQLLQLEQAQALAEAEGHRAEEQARRMEEQAHAARRFRFLSLALAGLLALAVGLLIFALDQRAQALSQQNLAHLNALEATTAKQEALMKAEQARAKARLAAERQDEARRARAEADAANKTSKEERAKAAEQARLAEKARAQAVASQERAEKEHQRTLDQRRLASTSQAELYDCKNAGEKARDLSKQERN